MNKEKAEALASQLVGKTHDQVYDLFLATPKAVMHYVEVEGRPTPPNSSVLPNTIHLWEGKDGLVYKYQVGKLTKE